MPVLQEGQHSSLPFVRLLNKENKWVSDQSPFEKESKWKPPWYNTGPSPYEGPYTDCGGKC